MAVIYIRISDKDKEVLESEADELRMKLATYCRMILMQSVGKNKFVIEDDK